MSSLAGKKRKRKGSKKNVQDNVSRASARNQMENLKETEIAHQTGDSLKQQPVNGLHTINLGHKGNICPHRPREFGKD